MHEKSNCRCIPYLMRATCWTQNEESGLKFTCFIPVQFEWTNVQDFWCFPYIIAIIWVLFNSKVLFGGDSLVYSNMAKIGRFLINALPFLALMSLIDSYDGSTKAIIFLSFRLMKCYNMCLQVIKVFDSNFIRNCMPGSKTWCKLTMSLY